MIPGMNGKGELRVDMIKIYCWHVSTCHRINKNIPFVEKKEAQPYVFYQPNNV